MVRPFSGRLRNTAHTALPAPWLFAALVVAADAVAALLGATTLGLAAAALIAPGFALSGLLPAPLRSRPVPRAAAAPALGLAATSLVLITIAQLGIPLTAVSVRACVIALVALGLAVPRDRPEGIDVDDDGNGGVGEGRAADELRTVGEAQAAPRRLRVSMQNRRSIALDLIALAAVLALATVLGWRVIGQAPVPGDDWAKYLLYADEIRRQGSLLLQNTLWMGGRPFSEDPGIPALEGAALLMTGAPAGELVHVILLLTLVQVAASFAAARAFFGLTGAVVTATLLAIVPATQNILGWHGLANVGALAILALVLAQLGAWLSGSLDRRAEIGLAITLIGVAAAHRLTAVFLVGTLGLVILAALCTRERWPLILSAARTLGMVIVLGFVVALDLQVRAGNSGGTLPYTSYLGTKIDPALALRDVTSILGVAAVLSTLMLIALRRLPRAVWPALALAVVSVLLTYAWVLHLPLYYSRTVFFLPIALAPLAGAGAAALASWLQGSRASGAATGEAGARDPRQLRSVRRVASFAAIAAAGAAVAVLFTGSWKQADKVRDYYGFASVASLRGLDQLTPNLQPNEIVATDRCWSFLATWLLHTRTYPALEEQDIQPKAELVVARKAAAILRGTPEGRELMRSEPVRWALLDPTCPVNGERFLPPGKVRFASKRLAIIELDPAGKARVLP